MATQTKMIIITSNEDLIRQFSLNNNKNTHIIDLDNKQQMIPATEDKSQLINLAFFAHLSELNSNNDQVFKRALDASDDHQPKPVKVSKKPTDMVCTICGDHAIGFNYDALSCASCKAFFRRNANQHSEKLRCLSGSGHCSVSYGTRRKCQKCRLDRCFAVGMRKDFILSDEEKQRRRRRLEENRIYTSQRLSTSDSTSSSSPPTGSLNFDLTSTTTDEFDQFLIDIGKIEDNIVFNESNDSNIIENTMLETLSIGDWVTIQTVESSFISHFQMPSLQCTSFIDLSNRDSALLSWSEFASQMALRFINFFRQIDEFEGLHADDRLILIKYNLLPLFPICKSYNYNPTHDCCSCEDSEEAIKSRHFFKLCGAPNNIRDSFVSLVHSLVEITEQDPTLLSFLLVILLFSQGLSMCEDEPLLQDSLAVYRAQSHYTQILWNYLLNKQGEKTTYKHFSKLLNTILRIQTAAKTCRDFFYNQFKTSNTLAKMAPLMQTVLHIS